MMAKDLGAKGHLHVIHGMEEDNMHHVWFHLSCVTAQSQSNG